MRREWVIFLIVDTTFIVDLLRKREHATEKLKELEGRNILLRTTNISVFELFEGVVRSNKPEHEQKKVEAILRDIPSYDLDKESAIIAGRLNGTFYNRGKIIGSEDAMIAGIALAKKEVLLTRNVKDFKHVEDLEIATY